MGAAGTPGTPKQTQAKAASDDLLDPARFASLVSDEVDIVVLPGARHPGHRPVVTVAAKARAGAGAITAVLRDPASYRRALPSLIRSDVKATRATGDSGHVVQRLIEWELEIPLFNLEGRAWLTERPGGVDLDLADGAFAPGQARFRVADASPGGAILVCELRIDPRTSNWLFRRVARHNPWAETAMTAAAAWTMARAVVLQAENPRAQHVVRPSGAIVAPAASQLDGAWLLGPAVEDLRRHGRLGLVRRTASGRLAQASVAVALARATPDAAAARLVTPALWQAFPGWGHVTSDANGGNGMRAGTAIMVVDDDIPFVDFDAVWSVALTSRLRATAVKGATKGAVLRLGFPRQRERHAGRAVGASAPRRGRLHGAAPDSGGAAAGACARARARLRRRGGGRGSLLKPRRRRRHRHIPARL